MGKQIQNALDAMTEVTTPEGLNQCYKALDELRNGLVLVQCKTGRRAGININAGYNVGLHAEEPDPKATTRELLSQDGACVVVTDATGKPVRGISAHEMCEFTFCDIEDVDLEYLFGWRQFIQKEKDGTWTAMHVFMPQADGRVAAITEHRLAMLTYQGPTSGAPEGGDYRAKTISGHEAVWLDQVGVQNLITFVQRQVDELSELPPEKHPTSSLYQTYHFILDNLKHLYNAIEEAKENNEELLDNWMPTGTAN